MAKVFFSTLHSDESNLIDSIDSVNALITNYWGTDEEIVFPIHRKTLIKLKESSDLETKSICLEVDNLTDKANVHIEWKAFNSYTLQAEPTKTYYILSDELFELLVDDSIYSTVAARLYKENDGLVSVLCHKFNPDYRDGDGGASDPLATNASGTILGPSGSK